VSPGCREKTEGEEGDAEGAEEAEEEEPSVKEMTLDEYKAQRNVVRGLPFQRFVVESHLSI